MSNSIDPGSIHLGDLDSQSRPEYAASYIPNTTTSAYCELPAATALPPLTLSLEPLANACIFQFPDTVPIPPVFNPLTTKFLACETMGVDLSSVTLCGFAEGSRITLNAGGPRAGEDGAPASCGVSLDADLRVLACTDFDATVNVDFTGAAGLTDDAGEKLSKLTITPRGVNTANCTGDNLCGFDLTGTIYVPPACEQISHLSLDKHKVLFKGWDKFVDRSALVITTDGCGLALEGVLEVPQACESVDLASNIIYRGEGLSGSISVEPNPDAPCSPMIVGEIVAPCVDTPCLESDVKITGNAWTKNTLKLYRPRPEEDPCCVKLEGDLDIDACREFTVQGAGTVDIRGYDSETGRRIDSGTLRVQASKSPYCGFGFDGHLDFNACSSINVQEVGNLKIAGTKMFQLSRDQACSLKLQHLCPDFNFKSSVEITTSASGEPSYLNFNPVACGIELKGKINIPKPCTPRVVVQNSNVPGPYLTVKLPPINAEPKTEKIATGVWYDAIQEEECVTTLIRYSSSDGFLDLSGLMRKDLANESVDAVNGCKWGDDTDPQNQNKLHLGFSDNGTDRGKLTLKGSVPKPCFTCDADAAKNNTFAFADLDLLNLGINTIGACSCCDGDSNIDFCKGEAFFRTSVGVGKTVSVDDTGFHVEDTHMTTDGFYVGDTSVETTGIKLGDGGSLVVGNASLNSDDLTVGKTVTVGAGIIIIDADKGAILIGNRNYTPEKFAFCDNDGKIYYRYLLAATAD